MRWLPRKRSTAFFMDLSRAQSISMSSPLSARVNHGSLWSMLNRIHPTGSHSSGAWSDIPGLGGDHQVHRRYAEHWAPRLSASRIHPHELARRSRKESGSVAIGTRLRVAELQSSALHLQEDRRDERIDPAGLRRASAPKPGTAAPTTKFGAID
eukprot:scaffold281_cov318-Pavlova_lutheri.AAC.6